MTDMNVLYDAPGPRARRRARIGAGIALLLFVGAMLLVVLRLHERGQFSMDLWGPLINPSDENFSAVWRLLGDGMVKTLTAAILAIAFSMIIGTAVGVARIMSGRWGRIPLIGAIELLRGLPVVVSIYFAWRVLPTIGLDLSGMPGGEGLWYLIVGLTAYNSVIIAEILRAGVASLPRGQSEAGLSVGLTRWQNMSLILLPQAFRVMLPALISQLIVILKDTSLAAILGLYIELLRRSNLIALNLDNPIQMFTVAGLIYILVNYGLSRFATWVEGRSARRSAGRGARERAATDAGVGGGA